MMKMEDTENKKKSYLVKRFAELLAKGKWRCVGAFVIGGQIYVENGVTRAEYGYGAVDGQIGECQVCGYSPLYNHYTVRNVTTKETMNVGSECLEQLVGVESSSKVLPSIESIRRKIQSDFKRVIYTKQLTEWISNNMKILNNANNSKIDKLLQDNPKVFYPSPRTGYATNPNTGENVEVTYTQDPIKAKKEADYYESRDRNYWNYMLESLPTKGWNPQTMSKSFADKIKYDGLNVEIPKCRKLTDDEKRDIQKKQEENVQLFLESIGVKETNRRMILRCQECSSYLEEKPVGIIICPRGCEVDQH